MPKIVFSISNISVFELIVNIRFLHPRRHTSFPEYYAGVNKDNRSTHYTAGSNLQENTRWRPLQPEETLFVLKNQLLFWSSIELDDTGT